MATPADQYDSIFKAAGQEWNVDPLVLKALALHESNGNAGAVGTSGEQGLMQIMPGTQQQLGVTAPFDPTQSIYGGAKYLAMALNAEGDNPAAALRYYNGGPGWRTSGGNPGYPSAVGAQYQKLAKADTGTLTDATPGPAPAADAPDYNNAAPAKPAAAPAPSTAPPDAYDAALKPGGGGKAATEPDAYTKALGATDQTKPPAGAPTQEDINTAMASGGDMPPPIISPPPSLSLQDLKDASAWVERKKVEAVNALQPPDKPPPAPTPGTDTVTPEGFYVPNPNALDFSGGMRRLGQMGVGLAANAAQIPLQIAIGMGQGADARNLTIDPKTGTLNLTPEALAAVQFGASPLRFAGPNALVREPPPTFGPPPPVTLDELHAAIVRADAKAPSGGALDAPGTGGAGPQPAGAQATPASAATLTPEQAAEYGSTADKQWLYKSVSPGQTDNTEYIPGITPTMAQSEQTVNSARAMKTDRNLSPDAAQAERELLDEHNTIRKDFFQDIAGSDVTQGIASRDADQAINDGLKAAFSAGGKVDPQPIADAIQGELNAPSGKLPAVQSVMKTLSDALQKSDGSGMETNPQQVYGMRRVINFLQSKRGLAENPAYGDADVQAALIRVKQATDAAIEPAAPGFTQAIANYADAQKAIEAREALQAAEPKLYDQFGRMQYSKMHKFMGDVVKARDPNAPLNPYQSLTEDQMNRLKSLHDDLGRAASADDLAKAAGSDTAQNVLDAVKRAAQGVPGTLAAGAVGHVIGGPLGAVAGAGVKTGIGNIFTRRAERAATRRMQNMLRPDPTQRPTRPNPLLNPLQPP